MCADTVEFGFGLVWLSRLHKSFAVSKKARARELDFEVLFLKIISLLEIRPSARGFKLANNQIICSFDCNDGGINNRNKYVLVLLFIWK